MKEHIICKKCGTIISGAKPEDQFTKAEIKEFKAIDKIIETKNCTAEEAYEELRIKRFYWSFMKFKQNHPDEYRKLEEEALL